MAWWGHQPADTASKNNDISIITVGPTTIALVAMRVGDNDAGLFVHAAEFMKQQLAADAAQQNNEGLFQGSAAEMQERWCCSAVKLNDGSWCVVPRNDCVRSAAHLISLHLPRVA